MCENTVALGLAAGGPSIVLLFAVLLAAWLGQRLWNKKSPVGYRYTRMPTALITGELSDALESAVALNSYNVNDTNDPHVRLGTVFRLAPREYERSTAEVAQRFREGKVLSIDLGGMDDHQAARLVDFCSGVVAMDSGWIFRVTDKVIVLTPQN